jgi:hypothetical protein
MTRRAVPRRAVPLALALACCIAGMALAHAAAEEPRGGRRLLQAGANPNQPSGQQQADGVVVINPPADDGGGW